MTSSNILDRFVICSPTSLSSDRVVATEPTVTAAIRTAVGMDPGVAVWLRENGRLVARLYDVEPRALTFSARKWIDRAAEFPRASSDWVSCMQLSIESQGWRIAARYTNRIQLGKKGPPRIERKWRLLDEVGFEMWANESFETVEAHAFALLELLHKDQPVDKVDNTSYALTLDAVINAVRGSNLNTTEPPVVLVEGDAGWATAQWEDREKSFERVLREHARVQQGLEISTQHNQIARGITVRLRPPQRYRASKRGNWETVIAVDVKAKGHGDRIVFVSAEDQ